MSAQTEWRQQTAEFTGWLMDTHAYLDEALLRLMDAAEDDNHYWEMLRLTAISVVRACCVTSLTRAGRIALADILASDGSPYLHLMQCDICIAPYLRRVRYGIGAMEPQLPWPRMY